MTLSSGFNQSIQIQDLQSITVDTSIHPRENLNKEKLAEYGRVLLSGLDLEPLSVIFDGSVYWLADGFHRHEVYRKANRTHIPAEIRQGTRRDAILLGLERNIRHGLPLTRDERKGAARKMLLDPEWSKWSINHIAKLCGVAHKTVTNLRLSLDADRLNLTQDGPLNDREALEPSLLQIVSLDFPKIQSATNGNHRNEEHESKEADNLSLENAKIQNFTQDFDSGYEFIETDGPSLENAKIENLTHEPADPVTVKLVSRGSQKYEINTAFIGRKSKSQKNSNSSAEIVDITDTNETLYVDITSTTRVINEILPPSQSSPEFRVLLVSYDSPLFADNGIEISLKAIHNGPAYALPMIFDQLMFHPPFAASVFKQAEELAKKSGRNFNN